MLQLVAVTAMFIARKYEDSSHLCVGEFDSVFGHLYTKSQTCQMELEIL